MTSFHSRTISFSVAEPPTSSIKSYLASRWLGSRATNQFNKVVPGVEMADSGRDVEMKRKNIQQIALPRNGLAVRLEFESGEAGDGPIRSMLAGNPFWIVEGQGPGLHRDQFMSVQQFLLSFGCINRELNRLTGHRRRRGRKENCDKTQK